MSTGMSWLVFGVVIGFGIVAAYAASVWACRKELNEMRQHTGPYPIDIEVTYYGGIYDCVARGEFLA